MADLVLVYGMRLLPADEVAGVNAAPVKLKNGNEARVTMHILEGSREWDVMYQKFYEQEMKKRLGF